MSSPRRVTCVLVNETDWNITSTGTSLNYKIQQGDLVGTMPCPIAPNGNGRFTLTQSSTSSVGPAGWACYLLENKDLIYQINFGDPAQGAGSFHVGYNYLSKLGDANTSVKFFGPSGPIDPSKVAETMDLTVEFHLDFSPVLQVATDPDPNAAASKNVSATPGGQSNVVVPPYFATWNQTGITQKRKKVLAAIYKIYPMIWDDKGAPAKGVAAENGGGTYKNQGPWTAKGTSCTTSCPMIGGAVAPDTATLWTFAAYTAKKAWVPFGTPDKKMPSVGDVYILVKDEVTRPLPPAPTSKRPKKKEDDPAAAAEWSKYDNTVALMNPHQRHVGIVVQSPKSDSDPFITADGGQKAYDKQAAHLAKRTWKRKKPGPSDPAQEKTWQDYMNSKEFAFAKPKDGLDYIYFVGGEEAKDEKGAVRLIGWLDIDQLTFKNENFDARYTEDDYKAMGAMLDAMK